MRSKRVSQLPLLNEWERRQVIEDFNRTAASYPRDKLIQELFEEQVEKTPDAVAVVFEDEELSYAQLNARANQLAHFLVEQGIRPDDRVAICVERSLEMVVGLLGILKAGGAYVPLDPGYPRERLAYLLSDSAPRVLLTQNHLLEQLPLGEIPVLLLEEASRLAGYAETKPDPRALGLIPQHLAYVIYTSGSTGKPKGVVVEHRAIVRLVKNTNYCCFGTDEVFLQFASLSFDAATFEIWGPLLNGGRLIVMRQGASFEELGRAIAERGVTTLWLTSGLFNLMVEQRLEDLHFVRQLLAGGDVLSARHVSMVRNSLPDCHLINGYGPTESTTFASYFAIQDLEAGEGVPIGKPIANTQIYILDRDLEPVPVGVAGELYIGGAGVARGYWNRPELTAEKFLADPFCKEAGARMYRTGDLGRWRGDGNIEYRGRNDFQVKIRGFRIELGEIENCLNEHAGVREAVVVAREDTAGDKRLVAYYTSSEEEVFSVEQLRTHLAAALPEYMVPAAYVRLERMPLTPNGKLDRKALPAPDETAVVRRGYEEPQGEVEVAIARIWQELLGLERVGRQDHFFELGGHSLLAVQLVSRLRERLGVEVALRDVFAEPMLARLAEAAGKAGAVQGVLQPMPRPGRLPLSWAQQRLWFLAQMDEAAGAAYHLPGALRLHGLLNREALRATLDRLVARHEILRTRIESAEDGQPVQVIAPAECGFALG